MNYFELWIWLIHSAFCMETCIKAKEDMFINFNREEAKEFLVEALDFIYDLERRFDF